MDKKRQQNVPITQLPADLYPLLLGFLTDDQDVRSLRRSCHFFKGHCDQELSQRTIINEMVDQKWLCPALLRHPLYNRYRPNFQKLLELAKRAPKTFTELFDVDNAEDWMIAALDGDINVLKALLDSRISSVRDTRIEINVAQLLLLAGHWDKLTQLLQLDLVSPSDISEKNNHLRYAAVLGQTDFNTKIEAMAKKLHSGIQEKVRAIKIEGDDRSLFETQLIKYGHLDLTQKYLVVQELMLVTPALHLKAAKNGQWGTVEKLIRHCGCEPDSTDDLGNSLLHYAALNDRKDQFEKYRTEHHLHPSLENNEGYTPLTYAVKGGSVEVAKHCIDNKFDCPTRTLTVHEKDLLAVALEYRHNKMLEFLLKETSIPLQTDITDKNHLFLCANHGNWSAFEILSERDEYKNIDLTNYVNEQNQTLPMVAIREGKIHFFEEYLKKYGSECLYVSLDQKDNINCRKLRSDDKGNALPHLACQTLNFDVVLYVLKYISDNDLSIYNDEGYTPLHSTADLLIVMESLDKNNAMLGWQMLIDFCMENNHLDLLYIPADQEKAGHTDTVECNLPKEFKDQLPNSINLIN